VDRDLSQDGLNECLVVWNLLGGLWFLGSLLDGFSNSGLVFQLLLGGKDLLSLEGLVVRIESDYVVKVGVRVLLSVNTGAGNLWSQLALDFFRSDDARNFGILEERSW
jgi:hypothetical protein